MATTTRNRGYLVTARHPVTVAEGSMYGPGEQIKKLDLKHPENQALVERGDVIPLAPKPKKPSEARSKEENDE